jgi:hypothetical protein
VCVCLLHRSKLYWDLSLSKQMHILLCVWISTSN